MRKFILHAACTALGVLLVASAASANLVGIANTGGNDGSADYISYNPSTGLTIFAGPTGDSSANPSIPGTTAHIFGTQGQGSDGNVTIAFYGTATPPTPGTTASPLALNTAPGSYTYNTTSGSFNQDLEGGSFIVTDTTSGSVLLEGEFGTSDLGGSNGGSAANLALDIDDLTYTGGSYFPAGFSPTGGSLSFAFTSSPAISANASGISSFVANDALTFNAVPLVPVGTPEPASFATFGIGALVLMMLGFAAKRRSTSSAL